jgi:hypothetical protein
LHSIRRFGPPPAMAANVTSVFGRLVISWTCLRLGRPIMPRKLCPRCHGQRTTSCLECHGTGKKAVVNIPTGNCEECGGTGRRLCDVCGVRAKSNFSRHIQNSPLPNIAPNTNWTLPSISAPIFFPGVHAESPPKR